MADSHSDDETPSQNPTNTMMSILKSLNEGFNELKNNSKKQEARMSALENKLTKPPPETVHAQAPGSQGHGQANRAPVAATDGGDNCSVGDLFEASQLSMEEMEEPVDLLEFEMDDIITTDTMGPEINNDLAGSLKKSLLGTDDKEKLNNLIANNPRPSNLPELVVPMMNKEVKAESIHVINKESQLCALHKNVTAALSIMTEVVNDVGKSEGRRLERKEIFNKSSQVISLLAATHKGITFARKLNVKHSLAQNIQHLCSKDHVDSTRRRDNDQIFEEDLSNEVDFAFRRQRVAQKIAPKNYKGRGRGQYRNPRSRGVGKSQTYKNRSRGGSATRGRGRARPRAPHF